jgi:putative ABC transport system substrate-binding protein
VRLVTLNASTPSEIEGAFATLIGQRIGAFLQGANPLFVRQPAQLAALATGYAVPAIYIGRETVEAGGLVSYGASLSDASRLAGTYVGRILKGKKPADLAVQQSTRIEMVLNLKTAKTLASPQAAHRTASPWPLSPPRET